MGINLKHAKKWIRTSTKTDRFHVIREADTITFSDGRAVIRVPLHQAWELITALPAPLPPQMGEYYYQYGRQAQLLEDAPLTRILSELLPQLTKPVTDTRLSLESAGDTVRVLALGNSYIFLKMVFFDLFERGAKLLGNGARDPVAFYDAADNCLGIVLPLLISNLNNPYLASLSTTVSASAA